ncbi:TBC domain-containingprotein [Purpureocillium lilacinum]|uniref:TBC domain-containingprotein n=1 Tax=Purpureocillium lilacinum TaxID=33203 RepID=A0A179HFU3_PURLI|nr:TBC domain-containingprotein [Purpureocillium lilacinum]OAQ88400.1 TBC domain-containingprotein [Purpureocillium lilacinum]
MVSPKSSSVRSKSRTGLPRPSFRDDTALVALRYEKTKPAEPPVLLPSVRGPRRASSIASSLGSTVTTRSASSASSRSYGPVVVVPPGYLPPIAPPTEQHPALRTPVPATARVLDEWKRDSGLAATPTSITIPEECEDDGASDLQLHTKLEAHAGSGGAAARVRHIEDRLVVVEGRALDASPFVRETVTEYERGAGAATPAPDTTSPKKLVKLNKVCFSAAHDKILGRESPSPTSQMAPMQPQALRGSGTPASAHQQQGPQRLHSPTDDTTPRSLFHNPFSPDSSPPPAHSDADFSPLAISIPTESLIDDDFMAGMSFTKRGSMMFASRPATAVDGAADDSPTDATTPTSSLGQTQSSELDTVRPISEVRTADTMTTDAPAPPDIRVLSPDVEKESQKVRSLYETGDGIKWEDGARHSFCERLEPTPEVPAEEAANEPDPSRLGGTSVGTSTSTRSFSQPQQDGCARDLELAEALDDLEEPGAVYVDRYGFISPTRPASRISTPTELKSAQFSPRRRNLLQKRDPMGFSLQTGGGRIPSRKVSARSLNTQNSEMSVASVRSSRSVIRQAGNLLPHNRNRRWMDEAGDMLTVSPSLQDVVEAAQVEKISEALKRKEWERSEKWRKMAKVSKSGEQGRGTEFEFDLENPKLIERTWKGIPDRWRAAAWWSFLSTAAKQTEGSATADDIIAHFHRLQFRSSPDDVQIDLDVPRTISRHIMFQRRYRGGQRLLFRVLHALSIYFPETGYVQGMASLAATLLCYFDEEHCFVMLVRMWQLRGLDQLYRPGFEGLMAALREFETGWLHKDVATKLSELCVDSTAYGTRWYLTLFNLSIPFPAQLRVWDVFLLLGTGPKPGTEPAATGTTADEKLPPPATGLDILHATSAALIQALREVLLDSDFENAMKALTSWIPIKDEDLLMKVTKAEWKTRQSKKKT